MLLLCNRPNLILKDEKFKSEEFKVKTGRVVYDYKSPLLRKGRHKDHFVHRCLGASPGSIMKPSE